MGNPNLGCHRKREKKGERKNDEIRSTRDNVFSGHRKGGEG